MADLDKAWINLGKARVLLVDDHPESGDIVGQIVMGLGVGRLVRSRSMEEAQEAVEHDEFHLILVNANMRETPAFDFIDWLRRSDLQPNALAPLILITGHTQRSQVERARDCGAHTVLAKPVSPRALLDRILWVAREKRPFVQCGSYLGPDRRFHKTKPQGRNSLRRHQDAAEAELVAGEQAAADAPMANGEAM